MLELRGMTLAQIEKSLERTADAVAQITAALEESDIDASAKAIHDVGRRAKQLAGELGSLLEKLRERADAASMSADNAEALAEELNSLADQLYEFED